MPVPADRIVLTSTILTLGSTTAASMLPEQYGGKGELPQPRLLIGTSLTFLGLSMLADFAPGFAGPLSGAIAVTALTYYGIPILDNWFNGHHNVVGTHPTRMSDTPHPGAAPVAHGPKGTTGNRPT